MPRTLKDTDGNDFNLDAVVNGIIASKGGGDQSKALAVMVEENFDLRQRNKALRDEATKTAAPEGSITLSKDEAQLWEKVRGFKPDEVTKKLMERDDFESKYNGLLLENVVRDAAAASNMKFGVLKDLVSSKNLEITMGEAQVDDGKGGKTKQITAFVKDTNGQPKPLVDLIKDQFSDYIPALQLSEVNQVSQAGTPWVSQQPVGGSGGKATTPNAAQAYIQSAYGPKPEAAGAGAATK